MAVADVMKMVKDNEVKFVDFRFTDTRGKEQHVSVPVKVFTESKFTDGHFFDGSSIAGWKSIEASDMLLMPDPDSARMDPFTDEPVLNITCDVVEPSDGKGYDRDPRSIAKRAEMYLKSTGLGDTAYFGPEPEFFIFDSVTWSVDMSGCFVKIKSEEAPGSAGEEPEDGNMGHRAPVKGGYFPVPPMDTLQDIRNAMCLALEQQGVEVEVHHHEVAAAGQNEIGTKFERLGEGRGGVQKKTPPGDPIDKNLYDLPPSQARKVPNVCSSLEMALEHLDKDHEFLTRGGGVSGGMLGAYIA